jgi:hypothetical protein
VANLIHGVSVVGDKAAIEKAFVVQRGFETFALMVVMNEFDGLLEPDGNDNAGDDGGDVDEEVAPGGVALGQAGALASDLRCDRAQAAQ